MIGSAPAGGEHVKDGVRSFAGIAARPAFAVSECASRSTDGQGAVSHPAQPKSKRNQPFDYLS